MGARRIIIEPLMGLMALVAALASCDPTPERPAEHPQPEPSATPSATGTPSVDPELTAPSEPISLPDPPGDGKQRCAQIDATWNEVPEAHRACRADAQCELISAAGNCFHRAFNKSSVGAYRAFLGKHGAGCIFDVAGMCPPDPKRSAKCEAGLCTVVGGLQPGM